MSYYPDGTGPNDPKAPWNEKDTETVECPDCDGLGKHEDYFKENCSTCDGSGKIEVDPNEDDEDWGDDE